MDSIYLVTGASGFLGNNIINELISKGKNVRALVLPDDKGIVRIPANVEVCKGNILDSKTLEDFFDFPDNIEIFVIHSAGIVTTEWYYIQSVYDVNVKGTENIVKQSIKAKVKKFVYISSVHALPELPKRQVITERTDYEPDKIKGFYGKTKAIASQIVIDAYHNESLNAILVFPSGLCGPYDYETGYVTQVLIDCAENRLPAGIKGGYDFVDVRDVARGVVLACEKGSHGEGYILSNRYVSIEEILRYVHKYTDARLIKLILPAWIAYGLLPLLSGYYKIRRKPPLYNRYSLYTLTSNSKFSNEKARKELGFIPRPFESTVVDTLNWLKKGLIYSHHVR
ncbi:MAG: NAD-dependent epimerase/dehydratase family protein [Firmicutes bacterium]|nr:NAD-dependent epimerase/dehydratase family protein [Bacillota bacterium]